MVVSKQLMIVCKVFHIILHIRHTTSYRNTMQLDNYKKIWFYPDGKTIPNGTSLGLQIVQVQYNVPTP